MNRVFFCCLLLLFSFLCEFEKKVLFVEFNGKVMLFDYMVFKLKAGDILFQDSDCGLFCEFIEKVIFGIQGLKFLYVGMVVLKGKGEFVVLEAIIVGVVEIFFDSFFMCLFDEENNSKVAVGRMKKKYEYLIFKVIDFVRKRLGVVYDEVFDIFNDKYYCLELIYNVFKYVNNDWLIFQL